MNTKYEILHTCIRVMDLEKSVEFYKNAFGFKVARKKDFPEDKFTLVFLTDREETHQIELTYNYDREKPYERGNGFSHIAVGVDDLEESRAFHKSKGYKVSDIYGLSEDSSGFYFVTDPDGYEIEVIGR
ncbi:MAG: VOC family protein [Bacillota bacterium]